jgi:hypothetical protein
METRMPGINIMGLWFDVSGDFEILGYLMDTLLFFRFLILRLGVGPVECE